MVGVSDDGVLSWPSLATEADRLRVREQLLEILYDARYDLRQHRNKDEVCALFDELLEREQYEPNPTSDHFLDALDRAPKYSWFADNIREWLQREAALLKTPWLTEPMKTSFKRTLHHSIDTREMASNRTVAIISGVIALCCTWPAGKSFGMWGVAIALAVSVAMLWMFARNYPTPYDEDVTEPYEPQVLRSMQDRAEKAYAFAQRAARALPELAMPPNFGTDGVFEALATPWGAPKLAITVYGKRDNSTLREERLVVVDLPTAWIEDATLPDEAVQQCAKNVTAATEKAIAEMKPSLMVVC